jgi:hypothetical protein
MKSPERGRPKEEHPMRPALLARVLLFAAMTAALTRAEVLPRAQARGPKPAAPDSIAFSATVKSEPAASKESAIESALTKAGVEITKYLKDHHLLVAAAPTNSDIRSQFLADADPNNEEWSQDQINGHRILVHEGPGQGPVQFVYQVQLKVNVGTQDLKQYQSKVREKVVHERQEWLLKLLVSVVVLLGALSGYYRLEEATKGYYTAWLRLGLIGVACAVGALLFLVVG